MPTPVSDTSRTAFVPDLLRCTRTDPPGGVNFSAFETRLSRSWARRVRSPRTRDLSSTSASRRIPLSPAVGRADSTVCSTRLPRSVSASVSSRRLASIWATKSRSLTSPRSRPLFRSTTPRNSVCSGRRLPGSSVWQELQVTSNRGQRRAQLVRYRRDELVLQRVELSEPLVLHGQGLSGADRAEESEHTDEHELQQRAAGH